MVDKTDGVTPETGITATTADAIIVIKNLATVVTSATAGTLEHLQDGIYRLTLASTLVDTIGPLRIQINEDATALPAWIDAVVMATGAYDALFATATTTGDLANLDAAISSRSTIATTDLNDISASAVWGVALTAATATTLYGGLVQLQLDAAISSRSTLASADLNDLSATQVAAGVWDEALSGHTTVGSMGRALQLAGTVLSETTATGVPTTTSVVLLSGATVDNFYSDMVIIPLSGALAGQARTIASYTGSTKTVVVDEAWTSAPAAGDAIVIRADHIHPISEIADGIWDEPIAGHTATTSYGGLLDVAVSSRSTLASTDLNDILASDVWAALTSVSTATTTFGGLIDSTISSRATSNASDIWAATGTLATGAPPLAPTRAQQFDWVYTKHRNAIHQTASIQTVFGSATSVTLATAAVSDDGTTFKRGLYG